ncbi:monovalent cation/H+ antiporter complex subunit F [Neoactinobaculum massilliense]|uniref:monovalent cation/H+ antiporter complex subunit F n=1 Tax=Neoactinobaculum massilliense TaxID=2364794 RepID=UPI000F52B722|nr:monovalent cation/H+ antiporter complex subunit F [Neoactinobaculum massilliense]
MNVVLTICGVALAISAGLVLIRIEKGPTSLDRAGTVDVMTSILVAAIALLAAATRRPDLLVVLVVVAGVGFIGSVAVARFARGVDRADPRGLVREAQDLASDAQDDDDSVAPVHDVDAVADGDVRDDGDVGADGDDVGGADDRDGAGSLAGVDGSAGADSSAGRAPAEGGRA